MEKIAKKFEDAVREYLNGVLGWDSVHELAVQMEWENKVHFPPEIRRPLEELHMIFLADAKDDPQFRADRNEILRLLTELENLERDASKHGATIVANRERAFEEEKERDRREEYLKKRTESRKKQAET